MGNKLIVSFQKVLQRNPSGGDGKAKSITCASEANVKCSVIDTECHSVVDSLGNFTRNASGSVRSSKVLGNKVSLCFTTAFIFLLTYPRSLSVDYNRSRSFPIYR